MSDVFYLTTPIYYVNAAPHIGHAYSTIVADVMRRYSLLRGADTFFLTGTDEHGDKIAAAAEKAGQTPADYVERVSGLFRSLWPKLNIYPDDFIRTTEERHRRTVALILKQVQQQGDIYFSEYEGLYCYGCERFYLERELQEGKCPDHRTSPERIREANYFFRMSRYQDWLIQHIHEHPTFIRPERYRNEVLSFLKEPLEDLCISRPKSRLTWGITLPFDDQFVTYVWFDALINYISALGYPDGALFNKFWPSAQHIIAKDILKPHAIYWPCMLKSAGIAPYEHLNVHGYWNVKEGKMSKSLGNVVEPLDLVGVYGLDPFRYFLLREMVFGLDSEFSEPALVARLNSDLANDLGNLVSRSLTMAQKYFPGGIPAGEGAGEEEEALKAQALSLVEEYERLMGELAFHKALIAVWDLIGRVNKYIDSTAPWVLAKSDRQRLAQVIFHIREALRIVSILLWPFMPGSMEKMQEQLGLLSRGKALRLSDARAWGGEGPLRALEKAAPLFPRIDPKTQEAKGGPQSPEAEPEPAPREVTKEDFERLDLRIGTIKRAEAIPRSKKLLKLTVDLGGERTIVAGLAGRYSPESLEGKQVLILANLQPVKLMGVESQGMVLAAEDEAGVHLLVPDGSTRPGSRAR